jgi:hypothetical protein
MLPVESPIFISKHPVIDDELTQIGLFPETDRLKLPLELMTQVTQPNENWVSIRLLIDQ